MRKMRLGINLIVTTAVISIGAVTALAKSEKLIKPLETLEPPTVKVNKPEVERFKKTLRDEGKKESLIDQALSVFDNYNTYEQALAGDGMGPIPSSANECRALVNETDSTIKDILRSEGSDLLSDYPASDIGEACPLWASLNQESREDFYVDLLASIAFSETRCRDTGTGTPASYGTAYGPWQSHAGDYQMGNWTANASWATRTLIKSIRKGGSIFHASKGNTYWAALITDSVHVKASDRTKMVLRQLPICQGTDVSSAPVPKHGKKQSRRRTTPNTDGVDCSLSETDYSRSLPDGYKWGQVGHDSAMAVYREACGGTRQQPKQKATLPPRYDEDIPSQPTVYVDCSLSETDYSRSLPEGYKWNQPGHDSAMQLYRNQCSGSYNSGNLYYNAR